MVRQLLLLLAGMASLAVTALVARRPASTWGGVLLGLAAGLATGLALGFAVGLMETVLPFGQLEFWLARALPWLRS